MLRRYYRSFGHSLNYYSWGRTVVAHVHRHTGLYENFEALFTALLLALVIKRYIIEAYKIPSKSMMDTLLVNDRIFVSKFLYTFQDIDRGDIVVFRVPTDIRLYDPEKPYYIKRVVGLPGDVIEIGKDHYIYRNSERITDPPFFTKNLYYNRGEPQYRKTVVPEGHVLVFGDNSSDSYDGRYWGCLPIDNVLGKAFFRYWPVTRAGPIHDASKNPRPTAVAHPSLPVEALPLAAS